MALFYSSDLHIYTSKSSDISDHFYITKYTYTGGVVFFLMPKVRYMHSVWHLFVLAGSVLHYLCILLYVIPLTFVG